MSDVLTKLKGLSEEVRARIEDTADYKALMVMQRAIGEVETLFTPAAVEAAPVEHEAEVAVGAEAIMPAPEAEVAADATDEETSAVEMAAESAPEVAVEAVEAAAESTSETESAVEPATEPETTAEVAAPEIPPEDREIVAELAAATETAAIPPAAAAQ
jgi:hypothetical protein